MQIIGIAAVHLHKVYMLLSEQTLCLADSQNDNNNHISIKPNDKKGLSILNFGKNSRIQIPLDAYL